jgi:molybdopterin-guanine dinucleotide biosynthesis protein MobB
MPAVLKIVGTKKSGKTGLIERLCREFIERGFRVSALKTTSHDHEFDRPNSDTWRYRKAGAITAVIVSPNEFVCHAGNVDKEDRMRIYDILYRDIDLLFLEGSGEMEAPMIECIGSDKTSQFTGDSNLLAIVTDESRFSGYENFGSSEISAIADFLIGKLGIKKAGSSPAR